MGSFKKARDRLRGHRVLARVASDWVGVLLTLAVSVVGVLTNGAEYDTQVDQALVLTVAFAAFHGGTVRGLTATTLAALAVAIEVVIHPGWLLTYNGLEDLAKIAIALPIVFFAGNLRNAVTAAANQRAETEQRHAAELERALARARDAEMDLAMLNASLEEMIMHRTNEVQQAVNTLLETEQQLQDANDEADFMLKALNTYAAVIITNEKFEVEFVNDWFTTLTGYAADEVLGQTPATFHPNTEAGTSFDSISSSVRSGHPFSREIPTKRKDGTDFWIELTVVPQFDSKGDLLRTVGMFTDITDRKRAEDELLKFSRAVWQSPASVVITDRRGSIEYVNPTFEQVTGYTLMEALGQNPRILKSGETESETYRDMWRTITAGQTWRGELCNRKKSGELFWELASISGIQDESGDIVSFVAVKVDISEQKLAQAEIEESHLEVVRRLALATEFRDDDTGAHVQRIGHFAAVLGEASGLSSSECETLLWASALHDIGKLAIPDAILLKPGKLTDEEYAVMKTHATLGAKMLEGGRGPILQMAEVIARTHHERWDGSGYPVGLRGEDIPLAGRIVAICDVFDALTSERPYKRAWTFEEAIAEIERCAGTHFDPHLAAQFVANGAKFRAISQMLSVRGERDDESELLAA